MNKIRRRATFLLVMQLAAQCLYPSCGRVVKVDRKNDTITIKDTCGRTYTWKGAEDWNKGDHAAMIVYDNFTKKTSDDIVVKVRYMG